MARLTEPLDMESMIFSITKMVMTFWFTPLIALRTLFGALQVPTLDCIANGVMCLSALGVICFPARYTLVSFSPKTIWIFFLVFSCLILVLFGILGAPLFLVCVHLVPILNSVRAHIGTLPREMFFFIFFSFFFLTLQGFHPIAKVVVSHVSRTIVHGKNLTQCQ